MADRQASESTHSLPPRSQALTVLPTSPGKDAFMGTQDFPHQVLQVTRLLHRSILTKPRSDPNVRTRPRRVPRPQKQTYPGMTERKLKPGLPSTARGAALPLQEPELKPHDSTCSSALLFLELLRTG